MVQIESSHPIKFINSWLELSLPCKNENSSLIKKRLVKSIKKLRPSYKIDRVKTVVKSKLTCRLKMELRLGCIICQNCSYTVFKFQPLIYNHSHFSATTIEYTINFTAPILYGATPFIQLNTFYKFAGRNFLSHIMEKELEWSNIL